MRGAGRQGSSHRLVRARAVGKGGRGVRPVRAETEVEGGRASGDGPGSALGPWGCYSLKKGFTT